MADSYVCSGATMKCSMGTSTAKLTVLPNRTVFLTGQPMANISDHMTMKNLAPFGRCRSLAFPQTQAATAAHHGKLTPMPCMHNTPFPWMNGKNDYIVKGSPALLKSSKCQCMWGGTISLVTDGQNPPRPADLSKQDVLNLAKKDPSLNANSVYDGIKQALRDEKFLPGIGPEPDLRNVVISALRGNWADAGLSLVAAVPIIGDVATGTKIARKGRIIAKAKQFIGKDISYRYLVNSGLTLDDAKAFHSALRNERRNFAMEFYKKYAPEKNIESHLSGIDFDKPVVEETLPPPGQKKVTVYQYRNGQTEKIGNYFTLDPKARPTDLGIGAYCVPEDKKQKNKEQKNKEPKKPEHKVRYMGELSDKPSFRCLRSTSAAINDNWSVPGLPQWAEGGATQYFIPKIDKVPKMTICE